MARFLQGGEAVAEMGLLGGLVAREKPESRDAQTEPRSVLDVLRLPERRSNQEVERRVFLAVLHGERVEVLYHSVNSAETRWRWIRPHAFAHNGSRWHLRAWCETHGAYRDFTLSRIAEAHWPEPVSLAPPAVPPPVDRDWEEWSVLTLVPNPQLDAGKQRAVLYDYDLPPEGRQIRVRRAMENYLRSRLHLPLRGEKGVTALLAVLGDG
jgi:predicted DNA-binding transcriptional regulator YafY